MPAVLLADTNGKIVGTRGSENPESKLWVSLKNNLGTISAKYGQAQHLLLWMHLGRGHRIAASYHPHSTRVMTIAIV